MYSHGRNRVCDRTDSVPETLRSNIRDANPRKGYIHFRRSRRHGVASRLLDFTNTRFELPRWRVVEHDAQAAIECLIGCATDGCDVAQGQIRTVTKFECRPNGHV